MIFKVFSSLLILIHICLKNQVLSSPVLLWSNVNLPQSTVPLSTLSSHNLISDYICPLTNTDIELRILAVNDLTLEAIQYGPNRDHQVLLDAKKDRTNFRFYPNVGHDAYKTFSLLPQSNNYKCSHIHFTLTSLKTYDTLHDALNKIQTEIDQIETNKNNVVLIALIDGTVHSEKLSRQRRTTNVNQDQVLISNNKTCMVYANKLYWNYLNGTTLYNRSYYLDVNGSSCISNSQTNNSVIIQLSWINDDNPSDKIQVNLITTLRGLYWYLQNATLDNNEYRYLAYGMHSEMETPPRYSYVCTEARFVRYDPFTLYGTYNYTNHFYIKDLQFQPFNANGTSFGPPNYCTSFFTRGIWMGITSSLLCFGILMFGIYRLMTIKTNDRFDDPKGKPLIFKAQD